MMDHDNDSAAGAAATEAPSCPKCQGPMWDNREGKRNPKAPDFKCRDKSCDGVIWPPRTANAGAAAGAAAGATAAVADGSPACPICGGPMWDDRASKRNPKAPDFKCKNKPKMRGGPGCEGVIWPPRDGQQRSAYGSSAGASATSAAPRPRSSGGASPSYDAPRDFGPPPIDDAPPHDDDDLPF